MPSFLERIKARKFASAASTAVDIGVNGDAQARLTIDAGGKLTWGTGGVAGDTTLYREDANLLRTDDTFKTPSIIVDNIEIDTTGAQTDDVLKFDGTKFTAASATFGVTTLDGLTDVIITAPEEFQTLEYNGTNWVNQYASVVSYVRNAETTTITTGTCVYLFGSTGDHATVKRADNTTDVTSSKTVGVAGSNIAASQNGPVITRGYVDGIDLSVGYTAGDVLWLGKNGAFTKTKPTAPDHLVFIGVVVRATNNGIIYVATQNGYELEELHDVKITTVNAGDVLTYNGSLWTAASIPAVVTASSTAPANPNARDLWLDSANVDLYIYYDNHWVQLTGEEPLVEDLNDLADVDVSNPAMGNFLKYDGTYWTAASIPTINALDDIGDVNVSGATSGQFLKWNGSNWVADTIIGGATTSSSAPSSPTTGQMWFDTDDARTYVYYDGYWVEVGASGMAATVSDSTPSNPIAGQIWYKSDTGGTYIYYNSNWVEVGAATAKAKAIAMSIVFGG